MLVLALDASTHVGTVALVRDDSVVAERAIAMRGERAERLMPAVADTMAAARVQPRDLDALACGGGPGSFTSLRIAASIAKGMAAALSIPLLVTPSPLLIAAGADTVLACGPSGLPSGPCEFPPAYIEIRPQPLKSRTNTLSMP
jgi:tRNA threonylcarbamoyladenosine biosynthesis protein TsaB